MDNTVSRADLETLRPVILGWLCDDYEYRTGEDACEDCCDDRVTDLLDVLYSWRMNL